MANETVSPELADVFEAALRSYAIKRCGNDFYPFMTGYIFTMLKNGNYNEITIDWHINHFEEFEELDIK
jgi:hypothetical protein